MTTYHEMTVTEIRADLAEVFACPRCERRVVVDWSRGSRIVLVVGDRSSGHVGARTGAPSRADLEWLAGQGIAWGVTLRAASS